MVVEVSLLLLLSLLLLSLLLLVANSLLPTKVNFCLRKKTSTLCEKSYKINNLYGFFEAIGFLFWDGLWMGLLTLLV